MDSASCLCFSVFSGGIKTTSAATGAFVRTLIITLMTCMMAAMTLPIPFILSSLTPYYTVSIIKEPAEQAKQVAVTLAF